MAKYRLEERTAPAVDVFGISCHVPDYRLCWSLNKSLGLDLTRRREDIVEEVNGRALHYPVFDQLDEEGAMRWSLVCNTCGRRRLVPQQKPSDYFLLVDHETAERDPLLMERLRSAEFVLTAYPIEMGTLKMGHKLLL